MSTPTTHAVIQRLVDLSKMLDQATDEVAKLDEEAVRAKARHEVSFARAFLSTEGSVDVRKHTALLEVATAKLDAEIAEKKVRACRERIRTIRDQIDIARSLNSAVKSEWAAAGLGQP